MPKQPSNQPVLLTVADVARALNLGTRTVYRLIEAGQLPTVRVSPRGVRIHPSDLAAFLLASARTT